MITMIMLITKVNTNNNDKDINNITKNKLITIIFLLIITKLIIIIKTQGSPVVCSTHAWA